MDQNEERYFKALEHIENEKKKKENYFTLQKQSRKIFLFGLIFIILVLSTFFIIHTNKTKLLGKRGVKTKAVIRDYVHNAYVTNELGGTSVNDYLIKYEFKVKNETITGFYNILKADYPKFFDSKIQVNDTIIVIYDPDNPKNNKILEK